MTSIAERLQPHLDDAATTAAGAITFAAIHAGAMVPVDDPGPALPLGELRMVRARADVGFDICLVVTELAATQACEAAGSTELPVVFAPVLAAALNDLGARAGIPLDLVALDELPLGMPWGPAGSSSITSGLFVADEQIGNIVVVLPPELHRDPERDGGDVLMSSTDDVRAAMFDDVGPAEDTDSGHPLAMLRGVEMKVTAELGRTRLPVSQLLDLGPGSVVELDRIAGTPIDVLVNGTVIARGEVVVIDEEYGVRITDILGLDDRR